MKMVYAILIIIMAMVLAGTAKADWFNKGLEDFYNQKIITKIEYGFNHKITEYSDGTGEEIIYDNIRYADTEGNLIQNASDTIEAIKLYELDGFDKIDTIINISNNELKLNIWDQEDFISIFMNKDIILSETYEDNNYIREYPNYNVSIYKIGEDRKIEYELIIIEKPKSNVFNFTINYSDLEFYYQAPLYVEKGLLMMNATCNDTNCDNLYRPVDVVGSYAVYHQSKANNQYKTGKAFHIYRPKIIDAIGNYIYGELNIQENTLSIIIDSDWLNSAIYPIIIDPTFGYTSIGGSIGADFGDDIYSYKHTVPSDYGTLSYLAVYMTNEYTTGIKGVLISSIDNTIVSNGVGDAINPQSIQWNNLTYSTQPSISPSTDYYVGWISDATGIDYRWDTGNTSYGLIDSSNNYDTPTDPTDGDSGNKKLSLYANYTIGTPPAESPCNCTFPTTAAEDKTINMSCYCNVTTDSACKNLDFTDTGWFNVSAVLSVKNITFAGAGQTMYIAESAGGYLNLSG